MTLGVWKWTVSFVHPLVTECLLYEHGIITSTYMKYSLILCLKFITCLLCAWHNWVINGIQTLFEIVSGLKIIYLLLYRILLSCSTQWWAIQNFVVWLQSTYDPFLVFNLCWQCFFPCPVTPSNRLVHWVVGLEEDSWWEALSDLQTRWALANQWVFWRKYPEANPDSKVTHCITNTSLCTSFWFENQLGNAIWIAFTCLVPVIE